VTFEYLGHTADLRAVVSGRTVGELYQAAAALLRDALVGSSEVRTPSVRELHLSAKAPDERFFQFVRELVFLYDSERFLPSRVDSSDFTQDAVRVLGEEFDAARHHSERQIKALTRHDYSFEQRPGGYRAVLLFDL